MLSLLDLSEKRFEIYTRNFSVIAVKLNEQNLLLVQSWHKRCEGPLNKAVENGIFMFWTVVVLILDTSYKAHSTKNLMCLPNHSCEKFHLQC